MYIINYHHLSFYLYYFIMKNIFLTICCYLYFLFIYIILNKILPQSKTMNISTRVNFYARNQTVVAVVLSTQFYLSATLKYRLVLNFNGCNIPSARTYIYNALPD